MASPPDLQVEKARIVAAVRVGLPPAGFVAAGRHGCATARIALRQCGWTDPALAVLPDWRAALEPAAAG